MKKVLVLLIALFTVFTTNAQERIKVKDGLFLVSYGKTVVIEDEINQRSISMEIAQDGIDQNNGEVVYNVVCGKWTKRVVKYGLKQAIHAGIAASSLSGATSLMVSAAAELATWIYDDVCDYYGDQYK